MNLTNSMNTLRKHKFLILMAAPAVIFFIIFAYVPMPGIWLAFVDYNYRAGIFKSAFVGMDNFRFLTLSGDLARIIRNTILYNAAFILSGTLCQVVFALLLNEVRSGKFKKITQTVMILPHFISYVVVGLFAYSLCSYESGFFNSLRLMSGLERASFYSDPAFWPPMIVLTNLWKGLGYGTIIYFSSLCGVDSEMLEAAQIDGANTWQKICRILLPLLRPTIVILFLLSVGGIVRGNFGLFYNLVGTSNTALLPTTDIIDTYIFRALMNNFQFSYASAVSLVQSLVGFVLVLLSNYLAKRVDPDYAIF